MARLRIQWLKSGIGYDRRQRRVLKALGFHHLRQVVVHQDTPSIRGMVQKVRHLVTVAIKENDREAA